MQWCLINGHPQFRRDQPRIASPAGLLTKCCFRINTATKNFGALQTDIHRFYKEALFWAYGEEMIALEEEACIRKGLPALTVEKAEERLKYYLERIPYKLTRMRCSSFTRYFSHLKRLGYVEEAGREEPSSMQESYPPAPPRRYYRLTEAGKRATTEELSDPIMTLYHYPREKSSRLKRGSSRC